MAASIVKIETRVEDNPGPEPPPGRAWYRGGMFDPATTRAWTPFRLAFVLWLFLPGAAHAAQKFSFDSTFGELPKDVVPLHYAIALTPHLSSSTFSGSETVEIDVRRPARTIVLNALELVIPRAELAGEPGFAARVEIDEDRETASFVFDKPVKAGRHRLYIEFEGKIGEQPQGLFVSAYATPGAANIILATQMEATDARRVFPSWDEPAFRATYQLTATIPSGFTGVSNTEIVQERTSGSEKTVTFARTPKMSSYLLAFFAGEFEFVSGESDGVRLRVITTEGKKDAALYALDAVRKLLPYYHEYFGVRYPLPKLDLIAIPNGFNGAMENWGAIVFEESLLLSFPGVTSQRAREEIFTTISHEVAHQWFGNIVTMAWWDDLWLNEGFASWMENKATDRFNPSWQVWLRAGGDKNDVMTADAKVTTHPIEQPVRSPSEVARIFDEITYIKGAAFIRMLEDYVGVNTFREGIRYYIRKHQYSNTTTEDLWADLERVSSRPVRAVASTWTELPGFPLVKARSACAGGTRRLTLEQEPFAPAGPDARRSRVWQVPVSIESVGGGQPPQTVLLTNASKTVTAGPCATPVKLNIGDLGYYRVQYDAAMFQELAAVAADLPDSDRRNLISDTWAMAEAGRGSVVDFLSMMDGLRTSATLLDWEQIIDRLLVLDRLQVDRSEQARFRAYAASLLNPVLAGIGWDEKSSEPIAGGQLRQRLIDALGRFGDAAVVDEARRRFEAFLKSPASLSSNLRRPVLTIAGRYADRRTFDTLHTLALQSNSPSETTDLYRAMQSAIAPDLLQENLRIAMSGEFPPESGATTLIFIAMTGENTEAVLDFAMARLPALLDSLSVFTRAGYLSALFGLSFDEDRAGRLEAYRGRLPGDDQPDLTKAVEEIRANAAMKARELPKLDEWLSR